MTEVSAMTLATSLGLAPVQLGHFLFSEFGNRKAVGTPGELGSYGEGGVASRPPGPAHPPPSLCGWEAGRGSWVSRTRV